MAVTQGSPFEPSGKTIIVAYSESDDEEASDILIVDYLPKCIDQEDSYENYKWACFFNQLVLRKIHCDDWGLLAGVRAKGDPDLLSWIRKQKHLYKGGRLEEGKLARLESIGATWIFSELPSHEERWQEMYNRLVEYKKKNGHTKIVDECNGDHQLAEWMRKQRFRIRNCNDSNRYNLLDKIGFEWGVHKYWEDGYRSLLAYKEKHGNTNVPAKLKEDPQLPQWVAYQRKFCPKKKWIDMLNDIGFEWQLPEINDWDQMYYRLLQYKKKHGTTYIKLRTMAKKSKELHALAIWLYRERRLCKRKDRIRLLKRFFSRS